MFEPWITRRQLRYATAGRVHSVRSPCPPCARPREGGRHAVTALPVEPVDVGMTPRLHVVTTSESDRLLDSWRTFQQAAGLRPRTITERTQLVARVARITHADAAHLSTDDLARFLAREMSPGTRQTYHSALRAWHKWLVLHGHRGDDPTLLLPTPRVPRSTRRPIATEHLRALLGTRMNKRTRMLILLCAYEGMRVSEAAKVRGEDVDLVTDRIYVVGKGGVSASIPLSPVIRTRVRQWPRRGFWFPGYDPTIGLHPRSASTIVSQAMRRAGVPGTAHSLRHWCASEMLRRGADARSVQQVLRHARLATTELYLHVDDEQERAALSRLPDVA